MEVNKDSFIKTINDCNIICIDSSILIYHLEKIKPYDVFTRILIKGISEKKAMCVISTLTITELLTKPYRISDYKKVSLIEQFIGSMPNTRIQPVDYKISKQAASLRAKYSLRTPDAIIVSTAMISKSGLFITNDIRLKKIKIDDLLFITFDEFIENGHKKEWE